MPRLSTLVVAVDGSEPADRALAFAAALSAGTAARLVLVSVILPVPALAGDVPAGAILPTPEETDAVRKSLEARAAPLRTGGRSVSAEVTVGDPASCVLELADRLDADLVVAGRSGKGAIARALLGSVTTRMLHHAQRPLCVVP